MLTNKQLEEIKKKIEDDKILPVRAIKELHPDGNVPDIRKQLFEVYDANELRSHSNSNIEVLELTKEEKISNVERQLANMEKRKQRLLKKKEDLEK
jgi:hypothetical protein